MKPIIKIIKINLISFFCLILTYSSNAEITTNIDIPVSLTLEQAIDYAVLHNKDIRVQQEEIDKAKGLYIQNRSAVLPNLDLTVQAENSGSSVDSTFGGFEGNQAFASIDIEQPVFAFGKLGYALDASRYYPKIQESNLENVMQTVIFQITSAYYTVLLQQELINVNEEAVRLAGEHLKTAEIRFQQGVNTEFDVTRAKVELANRKPDLISAKNNLVKARQNFNQLLNLPPNTMIQLTGILEYKDYQPPSDELWEIAIENRPDLKSQQLILHQYELLLKLSKALYRPTITAGGNYQVEKNDYEGLSDSEYNSWSAYLKLTMPIFDGFEIHGKIKQANANLNQAKVNYESMLITAQREVEQAILDINQQKELVEAAKEAVSLAELALRMSKVSYENGRATTLDVADTELSLQTARTNLVQAIYDYQVGLARLKQSIGQNQLPGVE